MALPGETLYTGAPKTCADCGLEVQQEVLSSAGGYYIGSRCLCGPYTRESNYFNTQQEAASQLPDFLAGRPNKHRR